MPGSLQSLFVNESHASPRHFFVRARDSLWLRRQAPIAAEKTNIGAMLRAFSASEEQQRAEGGNPLMVVREIVPDLTRGSLIHLPVKEPVLHESIHEMWIQMARIKARVDAAAVFVFPSTNSGISCTDANSDVSEVDILFDVAEETRQGLSMIPEMSEPSDSVPNLAAIFGPGQDEQRLACENVGVTESPSQHAAAISKMMEITEDFENLLSSSTFFDSCSTFSEFAPEEAVAVPPIYINDRALATESHAQHDFAIGNVMAATNDLEALLHSFGSFSSSGSCDLAGLATEKNIAAQTIATASSMHSPLPEERNTDPLGVSGWFRITSEETNEDDDNDDGEYDDEYTLEAISDDEDMGSLDPCARGEAGDPMEVASNAPLDTDKDCSVLAAAVSQVALVSFWVDSGVKATAVDESKSSRMVEDSVNKLASAFVSDRQIVCTSDIDSFLDLDSDSDSDGSSSPSGMSSDATSFCLLVSAPGTATPTTEHIGGDDEYVVETKQKVSLQSLAAHAHNTSSLIPVDRWPQSRTTAPVIHWKQPKVSSPLDAKAPATAVTVRQDALVGLGFDFSIEPKIVQDTVQPVNTIAFPVVSVTPLNADSAILSQSDDVTLDTGRAPSLDQVVEPFPFVLMSGQRLPRTLDSDGDNVLAEDLQAPKPNFKGKKLKSMSSVIRKLISRTASPKLAPTSPTVDNQMIKRSFSAKLVRRCASATKVKKLRNPAR